MRPAHGLQAETVVSLFFNLDRWKRLNFLLLPLSNNCTVNMDHFTLFYSFIKLVVQNKGQASELQGRWSASSSYSFYGMFSIILQWCRLSCATKPLWLGFHDEPPLFCWIQLIKFFYSVYDSSVWFNLYMFVSIPYLRWRILGLTTLIPSEQDSCKLLRF